MAYEPRFRVTAHALRLIEEIAAFRERIAAATVQVPWVPLLRRDARARTTHASTAIEGNPLTLEQVRALEEGRPVPAIAERARREVLNQLAGLRFVERRPPGPVTRAALLRLHKIIAQGVMDQGEPGAFRRIAVRVGTYVPPPPREVPKLTDDLLAWWNHEAARWSPILSSAVIHYRFEEIHPFADGNGRTGRALALWELYRRGFDTHHVFSVDEVYWEHRPRYYAALENVRRQQGDLTGWIEFAAEALHLTLERVIARVQRMAAHAGMKPIALRPKQEQLLQMLGDRGSMTPREIWEALGISKQGALDLLRPLTEAGLVRRVGTRKSGRYLLTR